MEDQGPLRSREEFPARRRNKNQIKKGREDGVARILFFSDVQYSMKGTGPCPHKLLIVAVGRLAPVVVTRAYRVTNELQKGRTVFSLAETS